MISLSLKTLQPTTVQLGRLFVIGSGACVLAAAIYRAPVWLDTWHVAAVAAAIGTAAAVLVLAIGIAIRGSARAVERLALEILFLGCSLVAVEVILIARSPETWSDDPRVQQLIVNERRALAQGIDYDGRRRTDVVRDLQAEGLDAVPGFIQGIEADPKIQAAIRDRGFLPLTNVSNTYVVECNEGPGYLQFRTDELGFNNPPGVALRPVDIAIMGASFALGHCVPPSASAAALIRARYPRTANFAVTGSRVLSQLGVFHEYVTALEPAVVVWFVHANYADPRHEASQPLLTKYLNDPSHSQRLRQRQSEVDSFVRELLVPLNTQQDEALRRELDAARRFPLERVIKLSEIRKLADLGTALQRPPPQPILGHFERAIAHVAETLRSWGGRLIVVIVPNYEITTKLPRSVAQYEAIRRVLDDSAVRVVDGVALFDGQVDISGLYTLRSSNHPSERGHALLADAVVAAVQDEEIP